jgi:predicted unusual protein kinase regulating ubiquinone biosynthesis (AarF/ABC1/UbiB family)
MSLAKLSIGASSRLASHKISGFFSDDINGQRLTKLLLSQATVLASELGQLKGSAMKVGQMISVYGEHFLPPEVNQILKSLQYKSPSLEWTAIEKVLLEQLGAEKLALLEIDYQPLASASIGQVHRARIKASGHEIVLKIQYPGLDKAIDSDLKALRTLFGVLQVLPQAPPLDQIFAEVREMFLQEVDYRKELDSTAFFRTAVQDDPRLIVPEVFAEFSTSRVLATSYETGEFIDSPTVQALSQERRNHLAQVALELYFRELFELGFVQTDPHMGNYRVRLSSDGKNDQLVLLDFGAVRRFTPEFVSDYKDLIRASLARDSQGVQAAAEKLGFSQSGDPPELKKIFTEFCAMMVEPFRIANELPEQSELFDSEGRYDWRASDLPKRLTVKVSHVLRGFRLREPPREVVFLDRKTGGVFIFCSILGAKLQVREVLLGYLGHDPHPKSKTKSPNP